LGIGFAISLKCGASRRKPDTEDHRHSPLPDPQNALRASLPQRFYFAPLVCVDRHLPACGPAGHAALRRRFSFEIKYQCNNVNTMF
jgi:hypothetical protein